MFGSATSPSLGASVSLARPPMALFSEKKPPGGTTTSPAWKPLPVLPATSSAASRLSRVAIVYPNCWPPCGALYCAFLAELIRTCWKPTSMPDPPWTSLAIFTELCHSKRGATTFTLVGSVADAMCVVPVTDGSCVPAVKKDASSGPAGSFFFAGAVGPSRCTSRMTARFPIEPWSPSIIERIRSVGWLFVLDPHYRSRRFTISQPLCHRDCPIGQQHPNVLRNFSRRRWLRMFVHSVALRATECTKRKADRCPPHTSLRTSPTTDCRRRCSAVVIAGLQHHDVIVVDEVDKSVFLIDAT